MVAETLTVDRERLEKAYLKARDRLLSERAPEGFWVGELSTSALSTATAIAAIHIEGSSNPEYVRNGLEWLATHQNADGGWGDTLKSKSNISTTMLCRAAFHIAKEVEKYSVTLQKCESWLHQNYGKTQAELAEAIRNRYGKDRTFSVPILMMSALAGLVPWKEVPRLPFEMACIPQSWYHFARLPVVSYALPALIAIGQVVHHFRRLWNPFTIVTRFLGRRASLKLLESIQPSSGGYLEAAPLTSFVVMSLASIRKHRDLGPHGDRVIKNGIEFLINSVRPDGSWPIDSNLSIWVTTLSINALAAGNDVDAIGDREFYLKFLYDQQTKVRHPYTGADPGSWGWSHFPGSVPDCDDTPGALIAIANLYPPEDRANLIQNFVDEQSKSLTFERMNYGNDFEPSEQSRGARILQGLTWVKNLQNRDGGWPTFCRGWGKLPFDRSGTDLTAHALRAWEIWLNSSISNRVTAVVADFYNLKYQFPSPGIFEKLCRSGLEYLNRQQRKDGSWLPLWFGNQDAEDDINPVYGTARVLAVYRDLGLKDHPDAQKGISYLLAAQNRDGGWGGDKGIASSVEETALAVEVLMDLVEDKDRDVVQHGCQYLINLVEDDSFAQPSPIGFYFAKLWYFERLYPIIFTVAALGRMRKS